jgi:hypothetical protein
MELDIFLFMRTVSPVVYPASVLKKYAAGFSYTFWYCTKLYGVNNLTLIMGCTVPSS